MATDSSLSQCKERIREFALSCGFSACGFAASGMVEERMQDAYRRWIAEGKHSVMGYMENHEDLRRDPSLLLDGAATVVSLAMNYYPSRFQSSASPQFSYYAYGQDYHDVVRSYMQKVAAFIMENAGGECRLCVDTAPLRERYWAQQAGVGFVGRNNQLIIPGKGSYFFLGEILTTVEFPPDAPCLIRCGGCRRCIEACPTGALSSDYGCLDARRCISCQTVESRLPLPEKVAEKLGNRVYGCDACQQACPHNAKSLPTDIGEFAPSDEFLSLTWTSVSAMTEEDFRRIFRKSAVKRAKYSGLMRNISALLPPPEEK